MKIRNLLTSPEGKILEFKRDITALKQIMKTIVAFANTAGGVIVIGREDNGDITGVDDPLLIEEQLTGSIADSIAPMIRPDIEIVSVDGKSLLCIRVAHWPGPFCLKNAGGRTRSVHPSGIKYSPQAGSEFIAEMKRDRQGASFDRLPRPELTVDDLDVETIKTAFQEVGDDITEEKLSSMRLLVPYGNEIIPN